MNNRKWPIVTIGIINVLLIVSVAVVRFLGDSKPPVISFSSNDIVYERDMDEGLLYEGVTAMDSGDGDVTDRILVEKIVEDRDGSRAIVTYAVSDKSGNVAKQSRVFAADFSEPESVTVPESVPVPEGESGELNADSDPGEVMMADETGASVSDDSDQEEVPQDEDPDTDENPAGDEGETDNDGTEQPVSLDDLSRDDLKRLKDEIRSEILEETRRAAEAEAARAANQAREAEIAAAAAAEAGARPAIALKSSSISTTVGTYPAWVNVIGTLSDDKDNYMTLFPTLKYTRFDVNTKGTYRVGLTVTDSDGNVSNTAYVNVTVK
ncbi:MAG: hypothetical protein IJ058_14605 [Lachnospiraceae bacterium]|nr:hypothetical protein [Lachnospiraceae bacterium]MBQ8948013.1 hypothetical protein [Lachnospiraceae bacterium]